MTHTERREPTNRDQKPMDGFEIESMPDLPPPRGCEAIRIAAGLTERQLDRLVGVSDLSIRCWESA